MPVFTEHLQISSMFNYGPFLALGSWGQRQATQGGEAKTQERPRALLALMHSKARHSFGNHV